MSYRATMHVETITSGQADAQAVTAVRRGDTERYRELVERHERRVYGVAWSRLGDPALAEEATQETFIRAFQRLSLLGEGAKFGAWIGSIARNVAINLGLRHRRELDKRERWALEETGDDAVPVDTPELCAPETLRQTLAELSPAHRECLVLFYLEGKNGGEAATILDVSEAAFRVRLSRARAALRERLEEQLGGSLKQLKPGRPLVAGIMVTVLAASRAEAATAGMAFKGLPVLAKFLPAPWLMSGIGLIGLLPGMAFNWWLGCLERKNFREPDGFRTRLHRDLFRSMLWILPILLVSVWLLAVAGVKAWGFRQFSLGLGILSLGLVGLAARALVINRSPFQVGMLIYAGILTAGELLVGLHFLATIWFNVFNVVAVFAMLAVHGRRPLRMDYNLFLRAGQGMLDVPAARVRPEIHLPPSALRQFARFLGELWLVTNFRWEARELVLRLPAARPSFGKNFAGLFFFSGSSCSRITLHHDGTVSAFLGPDDEPDLLGLPAPDLSARAGRETAVGETVAAAWHEFRRGRIAAAEKILGNLPDSEVFLVPPAKSRATWWVRWLLGGSIVLMLGAMALDWRNPSHGLKPVVATETEIRAALASLAADQSHLSMALYQNFVLPATNSFPAEALPAFYKNLLPLTGLTPHHPDALKRLTENHPAMLDRAMLAGWIDWPTVGVIPAQLTEALHGLPPQAWPTELTYRSSTVDGQKFLVHRMDKQTVARLRWLQSLDGLNIVNRPRLIRQICATQILDGETPAGQPPVKNWRDLRGLFFTPNWPSLEDTYCHLAALEILGGLDRIDRKACLDAILQRHRGAGLFAPVERGIGEAIEGSACDTFSAFESLRILGALDQVKDLDRWQFRVLRRGANTAAKLGWEDIEAWLCQQRLARIVRERLANPQAPVRSLLDQ